MHLKIDFFRQTCYHNITESSELIQKGAPTLNVKFEHLVLENKKATTAELSGHQAIIQKYAEDGYHYAGFVPTLFGPSGKMIELDLVFEKES